MRYQLVLQWSASSTATYDAVIELEDVLIEGLADEAQVDGHDMGSGEMNVFVWTDDPIATFARAQAVIGGHPLWASVRAAFREESRDDYTALWPNDLQTFEVA